MNCYKICTKQSKQNINKIKTNKVIKQSKFKINQDMLKSQNNKMTLLKISKIRKSFKIKIMLVLSKLFQSN